jgi:primosomal protein N''
MLPASYRVERMQKTLRRFEEDIALLDMRFKDLSAERKTSARRFAAALITETRAELQRLMEEQMGYNTNEQPSNPAA